MTTIQDIICGDFGSTDYACFSACGRFLAVTGAPDSTLRVLPTEGRSRVRVPSARDVGVVLLRTAGDDVELMYSLRRSGVIERYLLNARTRLTPLQVEPGYDLLSLTATDDGKVVAAGDSFGNVRVWSFLGNSATPVYSNRMLEASIYSLALGKGGTMYVGAMDRQFKCTLRGAEREPLSSRDTPWTCFTMAARTDQSGVAMAGDGNRIWLVDLPFKLDPTDGVEAGDGFPHWVDAYEDGQWALRKRIYLPAVGPDRCSYIDSNTGSHIARLYLTAPRELVVVGEDGLEVWSLSPFKLMYSKGHRASPSRRIFGAVRQHDRLLIAREK